MREKRKSAWGELSIPPLILMKEKPPRVLKADKECFFPARKGGEGGQLND